LRASSASIHSITAVVSALVKSIIMLVLLMLKAIRIAGSVQIELRLGPDDSRLRALNHASRKCSM
jgi:hypothetical protein